MSSDDPMLAPSDEPQPESSAPTPEGSTLEETEDSTAAEEGQVPESSDEQGEIKEEATEEAAEDPAAEAPASDDVEMEDTGPDFAAPVAESSSSDPADVETKVSMEPEASSEAQPADHPDSTGAPTDVEAKAEPQDNAAKKEQPNGGDESGTSKEPSYSTRGRTSEKDSKSSVENFSARDALEEIGRAKESSPAAMGISFLESLGDEERRTRTRFVPDVEGMHALRKHEIRDDITLARSLVSAAGGGVPSKKSKGKRSDAMDVDDEGGVSPSDDGSTDLARPGTKTIEMAARDLVVPSNAFLAPAAGGDPQGSSIPALKTYNGIKSPLLVEAVTAFNPPRPPESVGAKKKHRMLRWERRPEDIEVDLNNYRKTVQRTREELQKAEAENNRLETIDAHLRWNFLGHLNLINEEYTLLNESIASVQQECVKSADLLTSRTRRRGAGKGSYVMRDVLGVLKQKGSETAETMETNETVPITTPSAHPGIGGLASSVFGDWNRKTHIKRREPASSWTVPGDKVQTPYGVGTVAEVLAPQVVRDDTDALDTYLPPRVSVKLPFGLGYFGLDAITHLETPCTFSDAKLAKRWLSLMESASAAGGTIDLEGINQISKDKPFSAESIGGHDESSQMEVDPSAPKTSSEGGQSSHGSDDDDDERFMPFGGGLIPTATGRGNLLDKFSITDIEKAMEKGLYKGSGVLGEVSVALSG